MTTEEKDPPSPIPTPADFPIDWQKPEDEELFWQQDRMHFPEPVPPLTMLFAGSFNEGISRAAETLGVPIKIHYGLINTYMFNALVPTVPVDQMEAQGEKATANVGKAMGRLQEWWESELLPEVQEHLAWWENLDLNGASMEDLLGHLKETQERLTRLWDIHFLVAFPFIAAPSIFNDLYEDLFEKKDEFDAYRLLQGFGNKTVEGGHALWALSRKALASAPVREALENNTPGDVPAALETTAEGQSFLSEFREYLEQYGQRSDVFADVSNPHWIENPATPIQNLKNFLKDSDKDLAGDQAALAAEREKLIGEARERLKGYPQAVRDQFEFLLKAAQAATTIQEDHNFWIDQRGTYKVRLVLLEFGRRFADAGVIDDPEDVFLLTTEEVISTAKGLPKGDQRAAVAERKAEMERFRPVAAPPAIGTPPTEPPPDNPLIRALGRFAGEPPAPSDDPAVLNGNAGSPGKVTGTARVVASLAEAGKLNPGEIMVAPATMPAWTPLFASIAGVVTDAGGILSHAAIVAREYGIPAVLGTGRATAVIKDGQKVEVDGDAGVVRILS